MEDYIEEFLNYLEIERNLSKNTIKAYRQDLKLFLAFLNKLVADKLRIIILSKKLVKDYLTFLAREKKNSIAARARKLSTLKSFFGFLYNEGHIEYNPTKEIKIPKINKKEPTFLNEQECVRLLNAVRDKATPSQKKRDFAILAAFLGTGLRLSELEQLNMNDIDVRTRNLKVLRKGNKEQFIPLNNDVLYSIQQYLRQRNGSSDAALFLSHRLKRLSKRQIQRIINKYSDLSGFNGKKISPHTLRHSFASNLMSKNGNLVAVQRLLGHSSIKTTERYLHISDKQLTQEVNKINFNLLDQ